MDLQAFSGETLLAFGVGIAALSLSSIVRNLFFHPLAGYPGPRLWAASRVPYAWTLARGTLTQRTKELHERYGHVVRIAPNELSFIDGRAWHDIYAHHQGRPNFPKNPIWLRPTDNGPHDILGANDADHSRYRRLLAHAFSDKALREQEALLLRYVDLLVKRLMEKAQSTQTAVNMVQWLDFITFDIITDLSFGETFHCLEESRYHGWISLLFAQFKAATMIVILRLFGLFGFVKTFLPKRIFKKMQDHSNVANQMVDGRLAQGVTDPRRSDFMAYVLRYNNEKGMSVPEIKTTFRVLVVAGSETTATTLSGILNNLLRDPHTYNILATEVRSNFTHQAELTADRVNKLEYLNAVIEEGLRLCTPVAVGMPRIVPPGGAEVSGQWLPAGTFVSASGYSSNLSPLNFPDRPTVFDPSRWLAKEGTANRVSAFNPFSLGPRNCIGRNLAYLEMRLILARLIWHFDFEADGALPVWEAQKSWILWEKGLLNLKVKIRDG